MISKPLIERILDSYLNVLYEKQSKGITNDQWTNAELLREIWLRANNKSKWYCKTKSQKETIPSWVKF